jgi:hypothetical protein
MQRPGCSATVLIAAQHAGWLPRNSPGCRATVPVSPGNFEFIVAGFKLIAEVDSER